MTQSTGNKYSNFHLHKTRSNIIELIQNEKPISLITTDYNNRTQFAVVLNKTSKRNNNDISKYNILVIKLNAFEDTDTIYLGQSYYEISPLHFQPDSIFLDEIKGYHIGLPFKGKYTFVSSNWEDFYVDRNNNHEYIWKLPSI